MFRAHNPYYEPAKALVQSLSEKLIPPLPAVAGGAAIASAPARKCLNCLDDTVTEGLVCSGPEKHFTCRDCFAGWVGSCCTERFKLRAHKGKIFCFGPACPAEPWSSKDVVGGLRDHVDMLTRYMDTLAAEVSNDDEPHPNAVPAAAAAATAAAAADPSHAVAAQQEATKARLRNIVNAALCLTCPNVRCRVAIERIDGCNSMQCSNCNLYFCWLCFQSPSGRNAQESHAHVAQCPRNPRQGDLFASATAAHKRKRVENIKLALCAAFGNAWQTDATACDELRAVCQQQLQRDWGIEYNDLDDRVAAAERLAADRAAEEAARATEEARYWRTLRRSAWRVFVMVGASALALALEAAVCWGLYSVLGAVMARGKTLSAVAVELATRGLGPAGGGITHAGLTDSFRRHEAIVANSLRQPAPLQSVTFPDLFGMGGLWGLFFLTLGLKAVGQCPGVVPLLLLVAIMWLSVQGHLDHVLPVIQSSAPQEVKTVMAPAPAPAPAPDPVTRPVIFINPDAAAPAPAHATLPLPFQLGPFPYFVDLPSHYLAPLHYLNALLCYVSVACAVLTCGWAMPFAGGCMACALLTYVAEWSINVVVNFCATLSPLFCCLVLFCCCVCGAAQS